MPCGPRLTKAVADYLQEEVGALPKDIKDGLPRTAGRNVTLRAIRYALADLIKSGRAKRKGQHGPVYAVRSNDLA